MQTGFVLGTAALLWVTLLAYLRRDCEPSAKFMRALPRLQSALGNRAKTGQLEHQDRRAVQGRTTRATRLQERGVGRVNVGIRAHFGVAGVAIDVGGFSRQRGEGRERDQGQPPEA